MLAEVSSWFSRRSPPRSPQRGSHRIDLSPLYRRRRPRCLGRPSRSCCWAAGAAARRGSVRDGRRLAAVRRIATASPVGLRDRGRHLRARHHLQPMLGRPGGVGPSDRRGAEPVRGPEQPECGNPRTRRGPGPLRAVSDTTCLEYNAGVVQAAHALAVAKHAHVSSATWWPTSRRASSAPCGPTTPRRTGPCCRAGSPPSRTCPEYTWACTLPPRILVRDHRRLADPATAVARHR